MHTTLLALAQDATAASRFPDSVCHGADHWQGVADQGLWLAAQKGWGAAERRFLFTFGAVHDCQRINDHHDPEHGARAAAWIATHPLLPIVLPEEGLRTRLLDALVRHDQGSTSSDPLIGAAWDADRSLLTRVGIVPHALYFSTARGATFQAMATRGIRVADDPAPWPVLARRALS